MRWGPVLGGPACDKCRTRVRLSSLCTTVESHNGQEFGWLLLYIVKGSLR